MKNVWAWIKSIFGYILRYAIRVIIVVVVLIVAIFALDRFGLL